MRFLLCAALAFGGLLLPSPDVSAQTLALTANASTRGLGVGGVVRITDNLNARANVRFFDFTYEDTEIVDGRNVDYSANADLLSGAILVDFHPFSNAFRLSGGAIFNGNGGSGTIMLADNETVKVGNRTYTASDVGQVDADITLGSSVAPYVSLGIGNALSRRVGFMGEIGVMYQGSPTVDLSGTKLIEPTADAANKQVLEDNLEEYQFYPVISLGFSVRLF